MPLMRCWLATKNLSGPLVRMGLVRVERSSAQIASR
jgi:hypothetical protein